MSAALLALAVSAGAAPGLLPRLAFSAPQEPAGGLDQPVPRPLDLKSGWTALGITAVCELPTALLGPSCGHLYAGEEAHFFTTGGMRLAALAAILVLDRWGFGTPPLFSVVQPQFSRNLAAYPLAYTLDLILVAVWWGTGLFDLVDSFFAAGRHNRRAELARGFVSNPLAPGGPALVRF